MNGVIVSFAYDEQGTSIIEYALLMFLVLIVLLLGMSTISGFFTSMLAELTGSI